MHGAWGRIPWGGWPLIRSWRVSHACLSSPLPPTLGRKCQRSKCISHSSGFRGAVEVQSPLDLSSEAWSMTRCRADLLHPSLGFRLPPTPKHRDSHFTHRQEDFCLLMRHKGSVLGSETSSQGNNWPFLAQACLQSPGSSLSSWALLHRGLTSRGPQQCEGQVGSWRPWLWRQVQRRATLPPVSEGWARRTDIWPFKISVRTSSCSFYLSPRPSEGRSRDRRCWGWVSSEKLSPLRLKQTKFPKWFSRW